MSNNTCDACLHKHYLLQTFLIEKKSSRVANDLYQQAEKTDSSN